jgi:hypothetical protein
LLSTGWDINLDFITSNGLEAHVARNPADVPETKWFNSPSPREGVSLVLISSYEAISTAATTAAR